MRDFTVLREMFNDLGISLTTVALIIGFLVFLLILIPAIQHNKGSILIIILGLIGLIYIYIEVPMYQCLMEDQGECLIFSEQINGKFIIGLIGTIFLLLLGIVLKVLENNKGLNR